SIAETLKPAASTFGSGRNGERNQYPALTPQCSRRSEYSAESCREAVVLALPSRSAEFAQPLSVQSRSLCSWIPQISLVHFPSCKFRSAPTSATPRRIALLLRLGIEDARWHTFHKSQLLW